MSPTSPAATGDTAATAEALAAVRAMISACIQCGTCSGSCPNTAAMEHPPRKLWRLVLAGDHAAILAGKTFTLCSVCYTCSLRCPRGLPLTEAMSALKRLSARERRPATRPSDLFYACFIDSVRRHGRLRETEFMTRYFRALRSPATSLRFMPLGLRLLRRGKLALRPTAGGTRPLEGIFQKVAELERER